MDTISRVLAIQSKRTATTIVSYLTPAELDAILATPDQTAWHGRRDHALLVLAAQTGLRVSEITGLAIGDAHLGAGPHVYCRGKGRKDRCTPLTGHTTGILAEWTAERDAPEDAPLFSTRSGTCMSADAVARLTGKYADIAADACPTLTAKKITPLSRPGARFRCCHRPVSPDRSPNPPYRSLGNGLSTLPAVRRGSQVARGRGSGCPGRRNG
jgi:integrase/recombinase XerD